jgi:glycosyltransferase involved in cell wall biosynthesis
MGQNNQSGNICNEYARQDCRFKAFHYENGGVSKARQRGLDQAKGEYIIHIDPDDWVDPDMLESLVSEIIKTDSDMVICDYCEESQLGTKYIDQNPGNDWGAESVLRKILHQQLHGSCCNKLLRRQCIMSVKFTPPHLCILEDELFCIRALSLGIKVAYLHKAFYHYRINNNNSLCHSVSDKMLQSKQDAIHEMECVLSSDSRFTEDDFYLIKRNVLFDVFRTKRFNRLSELYPEIHARMVESGKSYRPLMPQSYCLSLAMRGYPRWAYILYFATIDSLNLWKSIKSICYS